MTARTALVAGHLRRGRRDLRLDLRVERVHLRPVQPDRRDLVRHLNPHELAHAVHLHTETTRVPAALSSGRRIPGQPYVTAPRFPAPGRSGPGEGRLAALR